VDDGDAGARAEAGSIEPSPKAARLGRRIARGLDLWAEVTAIATAVVAVILLIVYVRERRQRRRRRDGRR
jgi:hypothetical protein